MPSTPEERAERALRQRAIVRAMLHKFRSASPDDELLTEEEIAANVEEQRQWESTPQYRVTYGRVTKLNITEEEAINDLLLFREPTEAFLQALANFRHAVRMQADDDRQEDY